MTTWRRYFRSLFIRHTDGSAPLTPLGSIYQPMIDIDIFRFVILQHLQAAKEQEQLVITYNEYQALMIDELRFGGCEVILQVDANGTLCYSIGADTPGKVA
ncbi:MAG: hypothetical protein ABW007_24705 [Chitinophagaceae bacterium]